jgi:GT2 family glycosyltransferase
MISLIIPASTRTKEYTNALIKNIEEIYPNRDEVEIILQEDDSLTMGNNYNKAVEKANGKKIILLHNDMILKPGFVEEMDRHITRNRITTYTRVEPPIYTDTYPGKILLDCGNNLETFNKKKFEEIKVEESLVDGGTQLFFGCFKEDYIGIDGDTFKLFCEDDDFHLRCTIAGFERKVSSAHVYHFVSKTSRTTEDYQQIEFNSNKNFIRKWGSRNNNIRYNIAFIAKHANMQIVETLEPWCDKFYIEDKMQTIITNYIEREQPNTKFDLSKRILTLEHNNPQGENDIVVEFDATKLSQQSFNIIQQLPNIIKESGEVGEFELDIFKITIISLIEYQNDLIYLKNN